MNFFDYKQTKSKGKLRALYFTPFFSSENIGIESI